MIFFGDNATITGLILSFTTRDLKSYRMICSRCSKMEGLKIHMKPVKRKGGFHKQTKFICKRCGLVRMKANRS